MDLSIEPIANALVELVEGIVEDYSQKLIQTAFAGRSIELDNTRHHHNFLSEMDLELHRVYRSRIANILPGFVYASEEGDPQLIVQDPTGTPEFVVVVDPLDSSELAVRAWNGYTHAVIYSIPRRRPIVAVIGDMFHEVRIYCAFATKDGGDRAFLKTRSGMVHKLQSGGDGALRRSIVTSYSMPPHERFQRIASEDRFLQALGEPDDEGHRRGRIGVDFGSVGLCHVASGATDAFIELAKGFALWDLYPGQYVLQAAGGTVMDLEGKSLSLELPTSLEDLKQAMEVRRKFIAARSDGLAKEILGALSDRR